MIFIYYMALQQKVIHKSCSISPWPGRRSRLVYTVARKQKAGTTALETPVDLFVVGRIDTMPLVAEYWWCRRLSVDWCDEVYLALRRKVNEECAYDRPRSRHTSLLIHLSHW